MPRSRVERWLFVLWCIVCLVAAEFASRLFVPLEQVPRWRGFHIADSAAAYRLAPNLKGKIYFFGNVHIRTNRLGLRDREYGDRAPGVRRVLMIGDSQTLGLVEEPHTLARRLEQELEGIGGEWEVINAGVLGYGTQQELERLRWLLPVYRPDLVVLTVFPNDVYDNRFDPRSRWYVGDDGYLHSRTEAPQALPPLRPGLLGARDWATRHINLVALATRASARLAHAARGGPARAERMSDYARLLAREWTTDETRDWARTDSLIGEVVQAGRAGGAPVIVVDGGNRAAVSWAMWPADVDTGQYDLDRQTRMLAEAGARAGAPVVNVLPAFRAAATPQALYFPSDDHWTPRGYALAASVLAPEIHRALGDTTARKTP